MGSLDLQIIVIRARVLTTMLASLIVIGCSLLTHVDYVRKVTQNCYHPTRIRDEGGVYCMLYGSKPKDGNGQLWIAHGNLPLGHAHTSVRA